MRRRWLRILLALVWFAWTGVIIPGHTRGAIPIPGGGMSSAAGGGCCHQDSSQRDPKSAPARSSGNCAVCQLAAHLVPGVVLPVQLDPVDLLEIVASRPSSIPNHIDRPFCFQSRGPPTV